MTTPDSAVASTNDGDGDITPAPDALRISADEFRATYDEAITQWAVLHASVVKNPGLPSIDLSHVFRHVPRFPRKFAVEGAGSCVYVKGSSVWGTSRLLCLHPPAPIELPVRLEVASTQINTLVTETPQDGLYTPWFGSGPNYVAVLALAWSYILSARWAEVMPACTVAYIASEDAIENKDGNEIVVDIGDAGEKEVQWWSVILQPGAGWKASMEFDGETFLSPWSVQRQGSHHFTLTGSPSVTSAHTASTPAASFADARRFLQQFVARHGIAGQSQAALAAVVMFPAYSKESLRLPVSHSLRTRASVTTPPITPPHSPPDSPRSSASPDLPESSGSATMSEFSSSLRSSSSANSLLSPAFGTFPTEDDLDKLILLSCHTDGMQSMLVSVFYDPGVDCRAASAWLQGQLAAIKTLAKDGPCTLGSMLVARLPQVSFLWLGVAMLGLHGKVFECARLGVMAIDLTAAAWSGTTQTFMQLPTGHTDSREPGKQVARADECRLLYLTQEHRHFRLPMAQWKPFGHTPLDDVDLEVREHVDCHGHQLRYQGFRWKGDGPDRPKILKQKTAMLPAWLWPLVRHRVYHLLKSSYKTGAYSKHQSIAHNLPYEISRAGMDMDKQALSDNATRNILGWLRVDGWARHERYIWGDKMFLILAKRGARARARVVEDMASDDAGDKISQTALWVSEVTN